MKTIEDCMKTIDERISLIKTTEKREMLSLKQTSKMLSMDHRTVRKLILSGGLPAYRIGNEYRIKPDELEEYIKSCRVSAK